jgi:hypothetical protein
LGNAPGAAGGVLGAGDAVGGARGQTDPNIILRDDNGPVLLKGFIAAGVISVEMGVDQILDGQRRNRGDRGLDLVVERSELPAMMMPSLPTATVMLPPCPSSSLGQARSILLPRGAFEGRCPSYRHQPRALRLPGDSIDRERFRAGRTRPAEGNQRRKLFSPRRPTAAVFPHNKLQVGLLGVPYLSKLSHFEVAGGRLVLKQ